MWDGGKFTLNQDGKTANISYHVKVYDDGSEYGINHGRISKLLVMDITTLVPVILAAYDRGWSHKPEDTLAMRAVQKVMEKYA